jgi:hypothetical protein
MESGILMSNRCAACTGDDLPVGSVYPEGAPGGCEGVTISGLRGKIRVRPQEFSDDWIAAKLRELADRCGFSQAEGREIEAKFRRGRVEHDDDLTALDVLGDAVGEAQDGFIYPALRFLFTDNEELAAACMIAFGIARQYHKAIAHCREIEAGRQ